MGAYEVVFTESVQHKIVLDAHDEEEAVELALDVFRGEQLQNVYQVSSSSVEFELEEVNQATLEYDG